MTKNTLYGRDIISMHDLTLADIELILKMAKRFQTKPDHTLLQNKIIASCFFEPSTRTRLSFETAAHRLGARVIGFASDEGISIKKGESLQDTMRVIDSYADAIIIRHPKEGAARFTADITNCSVINAGDGSNQHPTQALTDIFTIQECQQTIDGLSIALVGDLKYGRTIHSFLDACSLFDIRLYLVSPETLALPESMCDKLKKRGVRFSFHQSLEEIIPSVDILYMTRIQHERFSATDHLTAKKSFILTDELLRKARPNLKVLHPLPRLQEIDTSVDQTPFAHYFQQATNGMFVRQALLALLLNESLP